MTVPPWMVPPLSVQVPVLLSSVWPVRLRVPVTASMPVLSGVRCNFPRVPRVNVPPRLRVPLLVRLMVPLLVHEPVRLAVPPLAIIWPLGPLVQVPERVTLAPLTAWMVPSLTQLVPLIVSAARYRR